MNSESIKGDMILPEDVVIKPSLYHTEEIIETLYSTLRSTVFNHRKAEGKDVATLTKLITNGTRNTFQSVDIGNNMEKSCFSIVLTDMNDMNCLIAHASFTDTPTDPRIVVNGKRWRNKKQLSKATSINTLFMSIFVSRDDEAMETCVQEIIANTFSACESVEFIILECPDLHYIGVEFIFSPLVFEINFKAKSDLMKKLIIYSKEILLPKLMIRPGRELDLDDLMPLINVEVKDLEESFNKSFLVDLISMQERNKNSIVAEYEGYAVGMIAVSSEINYTTLNEQFHLEAFHGLCKPYEKDEIHCLPCDSLLVTTTKASDMHLKETFDEKERTNAYRGEQESPSTNIMDNDDDMIESMDDDDGGDNDTDLLSEFIKRGKSNTNSSRRTIGVGEFGEYPISPIIQATTSEHFVKQPRRRESTENKEFVGRTVREQYKLLVQVQEITREVEENGSDLENAVLDSKSVKILTEAQGFINHCINKYLHKTLIESKLLPIVNINEPPPSTFRGVPNAVALQLVTLDKRYHVRINELLNGAFSAFPTRDYCIVTTPISAPELPWMKYFVRVTPKVTSLHPKTLYVMHRACFSNSIRIRRATTMDEDNIGRLLNTLYESNKIMSDYRTAVCPGQECPEPLHAFVAEVTTHEYTPIVGLAIVSVELEAGAYQVNYDLDRYTYFDLYNPENDHGYVHHFIMSPIFQPYSKIMMKEIMRLMRKNCLYHKIFPVTAQKKVIQNQTLLNNLDDWIPLVPRRRIEYSLLNLNGVYDDLRQPPRFALPSTIPYAAFHYSKKFTFDPKIVISKRVVFIGASNTTLSCLEKIISAPFFDLKNFTLISTHGLPGALPGDEIRNFFFPKRNGPALSMKTNEEWHQRLPIRSAVTTVYGTAIRILRKIKTVVVDDSKIVPYDILVIATGRQFIRPDLPQPEIIDERLDDFKRSLIKDESEKPVRVPSPPKPKNVFVINTEVDAALALNFLRSFIPFVSNRQIIVHGLCLEGYCCLRALIELGVSPHRITFVTAGGDEMEWEAYHGYRCTSTLRNLMAETISQLGIQVLNNYDFRRWNMDPESGLCNRVYFGASEGYDPTPTKLSVPCLAYFSYSIRRVGDEIATAIASAFVPYNNGILINTLFETDEPTIMAAGPCAIYDKKLCAEKYDHYYYSSYEIGQMLGEFILKRILPPIRSVNVNMVGPGVSSLTPLMTYPLAHFAELPGSWYYLHVSPPGWVPHCCRQAECECEICECGTEIITGSVKRIKDPDQKYFRLRLDSFQRVDTLECISRQKFPPSCLTSLYGHHEGFLNKLYERLDAKEIKDLYQHFCQPWVAALTMDRWLDFRKEIHELMLNYDIAPDIKIAEFVRDYLNNLENENVFKVDSNILRHVFENINLKAAIESKFLNFLKYNKAVLPMYARPDFVEETYKERLASPMYLPLHKNFLL